MGNSEFTVGSDEHLLGFTISVCREMGLPGSFGMHNPKYTQIYVRAKMTINYLYSPFWDSLSRKVSQRFNKLSVLKEYETTATFIAQLHRRGVTGIRTAFVVEIVS